jgi:hypothetical protein
MLPPRRIVVADFTKGALEEETMSLLSQKEERDEVCRAVGRMSRGLYPTNPLANNPYARRSVERLAEAIAAR